MNETKNILGLDLGTNSIGWALLSKSDCDAKPELHLGSRIIPMSQDVMDTFSKGQSYSQTGERTVARSIRKLYQRHQLRRQRLLRVLHLMHFLPEHYDNAIGWDKANHSTFAKFIDGKDVLLPWTKDTNGKYRFLFMDAFREMLADFHNIHPQINGKECIPYDWTLYYLRKKALSSPITPFELSWILLSFNKKRGYYQLRGTGDEIIDDDENKKEKKEYAKLKVLRVEKAEEVKGRTWWNIYLSNGGIYKRASDIDLSNWVDTEHEFIITTKLNADGSIVVDENGLPRSSYSAPKENDWGLVKKRTEQIIKESNQTVGQYIYNALLNNPQTKIKGKLVATIDRNFYYEELEQILKKQLSFIPQLSDKALFSAAAQELYPNNHAHRNNVLQRDFVHLFLDDILFYQRPLKSKKSLIANCPYEAHQYVDKQTGEVKQAPVKCVARSNPYFQEYRLWGFIHNLSILDENDDDVTDSLIIDKAGGYDNLFEWLNNREKVSQKDLLYGFLKLPKPKNGEQEAFRWNMPDKEFPANTTRGLIISQMKQAGISSDFLTDETVYQLWHLLYSISDVVELKKALEKFASKYALSSAFVSVFLKSKPFEKDYGSYSEKAIRRLLSVMRMGRYWDYQNIPEDVKQNIRNILNGNIDQRLAESISGASFVDETSFQGLPEWLACYVVYGRHSETAQIECWNTPEDIQVFLNNFKQHSLRNPIVEQVVLETMRTVKDIMVQYGHIDEIHLEMGRDLRNPAPKREQTFLRNQENEQRNLRIRLLLEEMNQSHEIDNVRPYSPTQQEILKIYEEGVLSSQKTIDADIQKILKSKAPTHADINRYRHWLEQKYVSPYTGNVISFSRLFSPDYQIEHIIPQARYFDNSFNNKVICEAEVNADKGARLAHAYIKECGGKQIQTSHGVVSLLSLADYEDKMKALFASNRQKLRNLMADDVPQQFINRQLNDTRYISRYVRGLLSNVVRDENELEATSRHLIPCTGQVTDRLKQDWNLNDVWNTIITPRFERLNYMSGPGSHRYGAWETKDGKRVFQIQMPIEEQAGFNKKRIDHRHHAMDALVIACANRNIVQYLANQNAGSKTERELSRSKLVKNGRIIKPWETFTQDAYHALQDIVVSFKVNNRILTPTTNYYVHYNQAGTKKIRTKQTGADRWAVRRSLHKATVFGKVNLRQIISVPVKKALESDLNRIVDKELKSFFKQQLKLGYSRKGILNTLIKGNNYQIMGKDVKKVGVYVFSSETSSSYFATRKPLDTAFDEKTINKITDSGIRKILLRRLEECNGNPAVAFSPEGIKEMNDNIAHYNNGKNHQPIYKVRWFEQASKFPIGQKGNRGTKFVEADKGTNLFFGIYQDGNGNRNYYSVPLVEAIERVKQGLSPVPEKDENGNHLLFSLSPNDLVYVPSDEEIANTSLPVSLDKDRIYRFVSSTGNRSYYKIATIASEVADKKEFSTLNKTERAAVFENPNEVYDKRTLIKVICWKLEVDRLGNITKIIR